MANILKFLVFYQVTGVGTGTALYRDSRGHGGLYCSACHGSPHTMFPSREAMDNHQPDQYQGNKIKTIGSYGVCHTSITTQTASWPHAYTWNNSNWQSFADYDFIQVIRLGVAAGYADILHGKVKELVFTFKSQYAETDSLICLLDFLIQKGFLWFPLTHWAGFWSRPNFYSSSWWFLLIQEGLLPLTVNYG